MNLNMKFSQVVGLSDERHWSQTFAEDDLIVVLELVSDGSFSAIEEGDKFLRNLTELFRQRKPDNQTAFGLLVNNFFSASLIGEWIVSLVVALVKENEIYLVCRKSGKVFAKRGNFWSEIISGEGLVRGKLEEGDILIFLTSRFEKLIGQERLVEKFVLEKNFERAGESLGSLLHNFDDSKGAAGIFALFAYSEGVDQKFSSKAAEANLEDFSVVISSEGEEDKNREKEGVEEAVFPKQPTTDLLGKTFFKFKEGVLPVFNNGTDSAKEVFFEVVSTPKKRILLAALFLLLVLFGSILFGWQKSARNSSGEKSDLIEELGRQVEEGEALVDLNNFQAKTILNQVRSSLLEIREKHKKGSKGRIQAEELLKRVEAALARVLKSYQIDTAEVFLDLTVVKSGASASHFALYGDKLAVLDTVNNSVIMVNTETLASSVVGGGEKTPNPRLIGIHGSNIFVLTKDSIVKIDTNLISQEMVVKDLTKVGEAVDLVAYAGNIYVLDGLNKKIWKFMAVGQAYLEAQTYLAPEETIGFERVAGMAIDGSIWVLGDNRLRRYLRGAEEYVTLEGLDKPLSGAEIVFTNEESKYLYLLDKGENRVVVFDKEGVYNSEYIWPGISQVSDMVVLEKEKKILLLSGGQIYFIDLRI